MNKNFTARVKLLRQDPNFKILLDSFEFSNTLQLLPQGPPGTEQEDACDTILKNFSHLLLPNCYAVLSITTQEYEYQQC